MDGAMVRRDPGRIDGELSAAANSAPYTHLKLEIGGFFLGLCLRRLGSSALRLA